VPEGFGAVCPPKNERYSVNENRVVSECRAFRVIKRIDWLWPPMEADARHSNYGLSVFNFAQTPRATLSNLRNPGHLQCPTISQRPSRTPAWKTLAGVIRKCTDRPMDLTGAQLAQLLLENGFDNFSNGSVEPMTSIMRSPNHGPHEKLNRIRLGPLEEPIGG
jgi:hypothetical protein